MLQKALRGKEAPSSRWRPCKTALEDMESLYEADYDLLNIGWFNHNKTPTNMTGPSVQAVLVWLRSKSGRSGSCVSATFSTRSHEPEAERQRLEREGGARFRV